MNAARDLDRVCIDVRRGHHLAEDLPLCREQTLVECLLEVVELARARLERAPISSPRSSPAARIATQASLGATSTPPA